jgi:hypothetical protein
MPIVQLSMPGVLQLRRLYRIKGYSLRHHNKLALLRLAILTSSAVHTLIQHPKSNNY